MGGLKRGAVVVGLVSLLAHFSPHFAIASQCWSSGGGDNAVWLQGTVRAGGSGVKDVSVYLRPKTWASGYNYVYESVCTDNHGNFSFKNEASPATACYSTYTYSGSSNTYCNWSSAQCYQQCFSDNTQGYYSGYTTSLSDYVLYAYPAWNSSTADYYGPTESSAFNINFSNTGSSALDVDLDLPEKNITLRFRVKDESDRTISSDLTVYSSGPSYGSKAIGSSFTDIYVTPGTYYVGAYCTDWAGCGFACISSTSVEVTSANANQVIEVNLRAKRSNAEVSGIVSGSDGAAISGGYVSISNYNYSSGSDACSAYGYDTTDTGGWYTITVPPGSYTMWASPAWSGSGTGYASLESSVTLAANENTRKNVTLLKKDGSISGTVKDSNGNGISGAWVSAWSYGEGTDSSNDWASGQTDSGGNFSMGAVAGKRYNVQAYYWASGSDSNSQDISNCSNEGMVTVDAPKSGVEFTFQSWTHTVSFALVDDSGNSLSGISGGGSIRLKNQSSDRNYCGTWVTIQNGSASKKLAANTNYIIEPYVWGSINYDPVNSEIEFTSGGSGGSTNVNIPMIAVNATVSGEYVDSAGAALSPESNYISVYATKGNLWRSCTASNTGYQCRVSKGRWCVGYWLDWNSGYASLSPGTSTVCLDVAADGSYTRNLTMLRSGSIDVTVVDNNGNPKRWIWVEASPHSAGDQSIDESRRQYWGNGCSTNTEGRCTITIGAAPDGTTYYLRASYSWSELDRENLTLPEEVSVVVTPNHVTSAPQLIFRQLDGELVVAASAATDAVSSINADFSISPVVINPNTSVSWSVSAADIVKNAYISCFSELGGYAEATADDSGNAVIKCTSGDSWHCVGINQIENNLYISEEAGAVCVPKPETTPLSVILSNRGRIPDAVSATWSAGDANRISLDDGFSINFPSGALGSDSTNVTCKVQPDPLLPYQAGKRPVHLYGYDITCSNVVTGSAITSFNSDATICLPFSDDQNSLLEISAADISLCYRDVATDAYICSGSTNDDDGNQVCSTTNHLTEFVLVGNGNLSAIDGDKETAGEECSRTGDACSGSTVDGGSMADDGGCSLGRQSTRVDQALLAFLAFTVLLFLAPRLRWIR